MQWTRHSKRRDYGTTACTACDRFVSTSRELWGKVNWQYVLLLFNACHQAMGKSMLFHYGEQPTEVPLQILLHEVLGSSNLAAEKAEIAARKSLRTQVENLAVYKLTESTFLQNIDKRFFLNLFQAQRCATSIDSPYSCLCRH